MSEVQKPVEETPVAAEVPVTEPVVPATEAAVEAPKETSAETTEAAAAAPAAETTEAAPEATTEPPKEVTPATDGVLGHKGPGLVKSLRFAKRFFYFSEEPVAAKNLSTYLQGEKSAAGAQKTAAWATQTGSGLLFYTKRAEDKATPAGIFNLSEVTDVTKEGSHEFIFKTHGHKHTFQASSAAERDSWLAALTAKTAEAEAQKETITSSEGYKAELEKLTKPVFAVAAVKAAPEKAADKPKEAVKKDETPAEEKKSRSQSRKRASIFGTILGKKDAEEKKEAKEETATEEVAPVAGEPAVAATTEASETPAATEAAAETTETPAAEATETSEDKKEEAKRPEVAKTKRASIFGNFFKVGSPTQEKGEKETLPVASTAPQLENPVDESAAKPIEPESVTAPATEAAEAPKETPATEGATSSSPTSKGIFGFGKEKSETTATDAKDKRRTSLFGTLGKKEKAEETSEGEAKPKGNKLGGLFRKPSKAVKSEEKKEKEPVAPAEPISEADKPEPISKDAPETAPTETAAAADKTEPDVAPEPVNVAPAGTPVQAAA